TQKDLSDQTSRLTNHEVNVASGLKRPSTSPAGDESKLIAHREAQARIDRLICNKMDETLSKYRARRSSNNSKQAAALTTRVAHSRCAMLVIFCLLLPCCVRI